MVMRREYMMLSTAVSYSMHALLYQPQEYLVKWLLTLAYAALVLSAPLNYTPTIKRSFKQRDSADCMDMTAPNHQRVTTGRGDDAEADGGMTTAGRSDLQMRTWHQAYFVGFVVLEGYSLAGHAWLWRTGMPFLPLMMSSVYCSVGIVAAWTGMLTEYVSMLCGIRGE
jgi:alpha-1,3-glucosyltransferase